MGNGHEYSWMGIYARSNINDPRNVKRVREFPFEQTRSSTDILTRARSSVPNVNCVCFLLEHRAK